MADLSVSKTHEAGTRNVDRELEQVREQAAAEKEKCERLSLDLSTLQSERTTQDQRIFELREEVAELRDNNLRLSRTVREAEVQLSAVLSSPGWKLIRAYRT